MCKWSLLLPRYYLLGAILMAMPVLAQAPAPSAEFWDYVEEFGDVNGNVLDPLEYDQIINRKSDEKLVHQKTPASHEIPLDKSKVKNTDMNFEQASSAVSSAQTSTKVSSGTVEGAKL